MYSIFKCDGKGSHILETTKDFYFKERSIPKTARASTLNNECESGHEL